MMSKRLKSSDETGISDARQQTGNPKIRRESRLSGLKPIESIESDIIINTVIYEIVQKGTVV